MADVIVMWLSLDNIGIILQPPYNGMRLLRGSSHHKLKKARFLTDINMAKEILPYGMSRTVLISRLLFLRGST